MRSCAPRHRPAGSFLVAPCALALFGLLSLQGCQEEEAQACPTIAYGPPGLLVVVRDVVTSVALCDAEVSLQLGETQAPVQLIPSGSPPDECSYRVEAPAVPAILAVAREGYERATTTVLPKPADACGYVPSTSVTVTLTPVK